MTKSFTTVAQSPSSPFSLDLDALVPGLRFTTPGRTVTEADVVHFAALTGDRHPQHVDASWAAGSRFGERVAHGMLVLSYAIGLVPLDPTRVLALRRIRDVVFKRPARLGDTIHVEGAIDSVRALDAGTGLVVTGWRVLNQERATVARAAIEVLWRRERRGDGAEPFEPGAERRDDGAEPSAPGAEPLGPDTERALVVPL